MNSDIDNVANEVFTMFMNNSEQIFTDVEYFENLLAKYPHLNDKKEDLIKGIEAGKNKIQQHVSLKKDREDEAKNLNNKTIREILKPKSKKEILYLLEKHNIDSRVIQILKENVKEYSLFVSFISLDKIKDNDKISISSNLFLSIDDPYERQELFKKIISIFKNS